MQPNLFAEPEVVTLAPRLSAPASGFETARAIPEKVEKVHREVDPCNELKAPEDRAQNVNQAVNATGEEVGSPLDELREEPSVDRQDVNLPFKRGDRLHDGRACFTVWLCLDQYDGSFTVVTHPEGENGVAGPFRTFHGVRLYGDGWTSYEATCLRTEALELISPAAIDASVNNGRKSRPVAPGQPVGKCTAFKEGDLVRFTEDAGLLAYGYRLTVGTVGRVQSLSDLSPTGVLVAVWFGERGEDRPHSKWVSAGKLERWKRG